MDDANPAAIPGVIRVVLPFSMPPHEFAALWNEDASCIDVAIAGVPHRSSTQFDLPLAAVGVVALTVLSKVGPPIAAGIMLDRIREFIGKYQDKKAKASGANPASPKNVQRKVSYKEHVLRNGTKLVTYTVEETISEP